MSTIDGGHYGDGVARRTKRLWTDEEKRSICFQTTASGVSVAQVARRCALKANLIFKWLRDPRFAPEAKGGSGEGAQFLPLETSEIAAAAMTARLRLPDVDEKDRAPGVARSPSTSSE